MEFMDVIRNRRSIRRYKTDPVPDDEIRYILEAARLAPSWANTQCWHFIVITDDDVKMNVAQAGNRWIAKAPVLIVACADPSGPGSKGDIPNYLVDMGIAMEHLILAATERGLGTCWVGWFEEARVKVVLGIPEHMRVVASTPLGYPAESPEARDRKNLDEIFSYNGFSRP